jgi:antirestriction protein ArdC
VSHKDIYQTITDRFLEALEHGTVPWQMPWQCVQNVVSQKPYRGVNTMMLGSQPFESPYWISFKQARDLGGHIKKGAKATPVIYFKLLEKRDNSGYFSARPLIRWTNVFNLEQTEGITPPAIAVNENPGPPLEKAAAIVENAKLCPIRHTGFAALYSAKDDEIRVPKLGSFQSQEDYFHTLFHEMTHATGHRSRLSREGITKPGRFGSERYSKEELIAEIGAAFLSNEAGILDRVQFDSSVGYLKSWMQKLGDDPKLITSAASQAQRASDLIRGIRQEEVQTTAEGMPLTWAREQGIDTRIPGFAHRDQDGDGASGLTEWKQGSRPNDRLSTPQKQGMKL